jgi:nitrilase
MRVACLQLNPQNNVSRNLEVVQNLVSEASNSGAQVVVLPEMFSFMGSDSERSTIASATGRDVFQALSNLALKHGVFLIGGSHAETSPHKDRVFNTCESYSPSGSLINRYRKIHLFNLYAEDGEKLFCESDAFEAGTDSNAFSLQLPSEEWRALTAICYDLRFPEIFRTDDTKQNPLDVVFLPAAFTFQTGKDHWEVLLRARAIENQCYIVACNQTGFFLNGTKRNYGHSMVISPWGDIVSQSNEEVGILYADISKQEISTARKKLPAIFNRML